MRDDEDEVDVAEPEDAGNVEVADDDLQRPATDGASEREGEDGERIRASSNMLTGGAIAPAVEQIAPPVTKICPPQ